MKTFANYHLIRDSQTRGHSRRLGGEDGRSCKIMRGDLVLSFTLVYPPLNYSLRFFHWFIWQGHTCICFYMYLVPGQEREMAQLLVDNVVVVTWFYLINCLIICNVCYSHEGIQTCKHKTDPSTSVSPKLNIYHLQFIPCFTVHLSSLANQEVWKENENDYFICPFTWVPRFKCKNALSCYTSLAAICWACSWIAGSSLEKFSRDTKTVCFCAIGLCVLVHCSCSRWKPGYNRTWEVASVSHMLLS